MALSKMEKAQVKALRSDARKLVTVAKHLRQMAQEIINSNRMMERAEKARTNFFSKPSAVDPKLPLTPDTPEQIFTGKGE